ncbi:hypothetical protein TWF694_001666 [Orbilia ellipsospora]|uniref:Dynein light chain n=1 Tax=Orbilia ellipsospora TaxID=2528407 RepID=A0AAV9X4E2_9PEZI
MADSTPKSSAPIPPIRIKQICGDACNAALGDSPTYTHSMTETWNTNIINGILRQLISESTPTSGTSAASSCPYKFAVNSTIIQHAGGSRSVGGDDDSSSVTGSQGRRGMHSACGGYWNTEKDGMWAYKHTLKDMDIVVSIIWIGV